MNECWPEYDLVEKQLSGRIKPKLIKFLPEATVKKVWEHWDLRGKHDSFSLLNQDDIALCFKAEVLRCNQMFSYSVPTLAFGIVWGDGESGLNISENIFVNRDCQLMMFNPCSGICVQANKWPFRPSFILF